MKDMLGVLGGMGPMASMLFYKMVTELTVADKDQDHINMMILSHATMPDRTAAILSGDTKEPYDLLLEDCKTLEAAGCKAITVTCNTAHFFIHQYEDILGIPVISMIREAAKEMGRLHKGESVAILATDGTIKTRLYQDALTAEGVTPYIVSPESQAAVMHLIYDCIKAGKSADKASLALVDSELKAAGCKGALLACTELSVIKADEKLDSFYTDPMEVMARRAIEFMGKNVRG